jgi:hypothetical protein
MTVTQEIQLRNSERQTFTTCPQKWEWAYVDRLKPRTQKPALRFGTLIHSALEAFYLPGLKRGPRPAETFERLFEADLKASYKMGIRDEDGTWHEMGDLGIAMLTAYFETYGKDSQWFVIGTEAPFRVPVTDPKTGLMFTFVGVVDGLWRDRASGKRKDLWVADHKTCKDDPTKKNKALILDEQSGSYWSYGVDYLRAKRILKPDQRLTGMLFNFLRKGMPDVRPKNAQGQALNKPTKEVLQIKYQDVFGKPAPKKLTVAELTEAIGPSTAALLGEVSKSQSSPLFHREPVFRDEFDGDMVRKRTVAQARVMHYMRTGKLEVYKVPGTLHSPHCNWCEFMDMCELHESGQDWRGFRDATMDTWEPYAQHEILEGR